MKRTFILTTITAFTALLIFAGCRPSRVYANKERQERYPEERYERYPDPSPPPSRYYPTASLIISPSPGFVMNRYPDGRYYHRSPQGYMYWKGYDNRFYIDRSHLRDVRYSQWEYDEWRRYSRENGRSARRY